MLYNLLLVLRGELVDGAYVCLWVDVGEAGIEGEALQVVPVFGVEVVLVNAASDPEGALLDLGPAGPAGCAATGGVVTQDVLVHLRHLNLDRPTPANMNYSI